MQKKSDWTLRNDREKAEKRAAKKQWQEFQFALRNAAVMFSTKPRASDLRLMHSITAKREDVDAARSRVYEAKRRSREGARLLAHLTPGGYVEGDRITHADGTCYEVQKNGEWRRLSHRRHEMLRMFRG